VTSRTVSCTEPLTTGTVRTAVSTSTGNRHGNEHTKTSITSGQYGVLRICINRLPAPFYTFQCNTFFSVTAGPSGGQSVSPVHAFHRDSIQPHGHGTNKKGPSSSVGVEVIHVHPVTGICRRGNPPTFPKGARLYLGLFCPVKDTGVVILALGGKLRCLAVKSLSAQRQACSLLACWLALHPKTLQKAFLALWEEETQETRDVGRGNRGGLEGVLVLEGKRVTLSARSFSASSESFGRHWGGSLITIFLVDADAPMFPLPSNVCCDRHSPDPPPTEEGNAGKPPDPLDCWDGPIS
jgi:hypothetical protein